MFRMIKGVGAGLGLLIASFIWGCASTDTGNCTDVNQDQIYQSLSASYDGPTDKTTASVTLRFSGPTGTTLALNGKCNLTSSVYTLSKSTLLGTSYSGDGSGLQAAHSFTFQDNSGQQFVNSATIPTIAFSGTVPTTVSITSAVTVSFTPALAAGETVSLHIVPTSGTGSLIKSITTAGATSITSETSDTTRVSTGAAQMWLRRSQSTTPTQITSAGGIFSVSATTTKRDVTLTN